MYVCIGGWQAVLRSAHRERAAEGGRQEGHQGGDREVQPARAHLSQPEPHAVRHQTRVADEDHANAGASWDLGEGDGEGGWGRG